jgi:acetyltransferase
VLTLNVETALASGTDIARAVVDVVKSRRMNSIPQKPVFTVWVGDESKTSGDFNSANIPNYATETDAVRGFMHLVRHGEAIRSLMETPPSLPAQFSPDVVTARQIIAAAIRDGRKWLDPFEVAELFKAYAIPIVPAVLAASPQEAASLSAQFLTDGGRVTVKIVSRDIVHKSDVGGVRLNVASADAAASAAEEVIANARAASPDARIAGVLIQPMIVRPKARELIAGIAHDPTFGPVIAFGQGGTAVEVINDRALALPPLDLRLARDLIEQTRVFRLLQAHRDVPEANIDEVALVLVKLAQLAADIPEVTELDINPLLADQRGVLSLDARVAVGPAAAQSKGPGRGHPHLAIRPYPSEWERRWLLADDWHVFVRPVRPEDEDLVHAFFERVSPEDLRLRFFAPVKDISHVFVARLTQLDYARAMAFVAIDEQTREMIGGVRLHADANHESAEFAILLRSDLKGRGLGWKLMELILEYARAEGLKLIEGQILRENTVMLRMCREIGFDIKDDRQDAGLCVATLELEDKPANAAVGREVR